MSTTSIANVYQAVSPVVKLINIKAPKAKEQTPTMPYMAQSLLEHTIAVLKRMMEDRTLEVLQAWKDERKATNALMQKTGSKIRYNTPYWQHVYELASLAVGMIRHYAPLSDDPDAFAADVVKDLEDRV